jgi:hypothetical protein
MQAPEVSDEQVITQPIKALHAAKLHSCPVRECPRTLKELYDNFHKFSRSELLHFRKLDQQKKVPRENEASRPAKYNKSRESTISFDNVTKQIHSIDLDGCGPPESWEKYFGPLQLENRNRAFDTRKDYNHPRGGYTSRGEVGAEAKTNPYIACITREIQTTGQEIIQFSWNPRQI